MEEDKLESPCLQMPREELEIEKGELTNPMEKKVDSVVEKKGSSPKWGANNINKFNQSRNNFNFKNNNSFKSSNFRRRTP